MDYSCETCMYGKKTMFEEPCKDCKLNNGVWDKWEPESRLQKLERLEKLCKAHDCCADCPVTDKEDTEYLCARFKHRELSEESIDTLLKILENESEELEKRAADIVDDGDYKLERHREICEEIHDLYETKNHDYGDSFAKGFREYGLIMPVIRLEDKFNRFKQLVDREGLVKNESVEDTLIDLANYAIMTVLEMREGE